ncbi:C-type lectin 37Db-like [Anastrepha ludens]|uniref:C-type lectin 37Db-like n=1 Tax=Anastrepha ludens TaxID=28586 RepID=UPI0023B1AF91|nr:C-type lectin 37Db-like [Anastrepha ludens]
MIRSFIQFILFLCMASNVFSNPDECSADTHPFIQIGRKYYFINTAVQMNWFAAAHLCRSYDSDLVTVESDAEMDDLSSYLTTNGHTGQYFWTSGNDLIAEGQFMSLSTGRPLSYARWTAGEPDNANNNESCIHLWTNFETVFKMNDMPCTADGYAICERRKPPNPCGLGNSENMLPKCAAKRLMQAYLQAANIFNCKDQ